MSMSHACITGWVVRTKGPVATIVVHIVCRIMGSSLPGYSQINATVARLDSDDAPKSILDDFFALLCNTSVLRAYTQRRSPRY